MGSKMKIIKTLWVPNDILGIACSDEELSIKLPTGPDTTKWHYLFDVAFGKKPTKRVITDNGFYPLAWPPKKIKITIEVVD